MIEVPKLITNMNAWHTRFFLCRWCNYN